MNTPIHDFVKAYASSAPARFHMPGHKGRGPLGCEEWDLTEIPGADSLYEAEGIIAESEANASRLFGCPTFYSTEGSSHCIRAMLLLAMQSCHSERSEESIPSAACDAADGGCGFLTAFGMTKSKPFRVLAARNVHKTFLSAAALLDLEVRWLPTADGSYLSAHPTPETLAAALEETEADAVYLTCPDYLGFLPDLRPLAEICHARGALLLVDNAHGAYLRFLRPSQHPMDLGADLCCDSAHKTLPVLTGGAYLHVKGTGNREQGTGEGENPTPPCRDGSQPSAPTDEATGNRQQATGNGEQGTGNVGAAIGRPDVSETADVLSDAVGRHDPMPPDVMFSALEGRRAESARPTQKAPGYAVSHSPPEAETGRSVRDALALFGSTSPSYLILQSLDLANPYLERLPEKLAAFLPRAEALKARLRAAGWNVVGDEPLKLTISCHSPQREESVSSGAGRDERTGPSAPLCSAQDDRSEASHLPVGGGVPDAPQVPMTALAAALESEGIYCEFADPDYMVFMLSPENTEAELARLELEMQHAKCKMQNDACRDGTLPSAKSPARPRTSNARPCNIPEAVCSIRQAMLGPAEWIPAEESLGRVLARPCVSCPPAVPILMPGERINRAALGAFVRYGIRRLAVLPQANPGTEK